MPNFFLMMAVGTTRVYVRTEGPLSFERYLDGLRAGRSFVTNDPLPRFTVGGVGPGQTLVRPGGGTAGVPFTLAASSA